MQCPRLTPGYINKYEVYKFISQKVDELVVGIGEANNDDGRQCGAVFGLQPPYRKSEGAFSE